MQAVYKFKNEEKTIMNTIHIVHKNTIHVTGVALRTSFQNNQHAGEVPPFFHRILAEQTLERVPHRINRNQLCVFLRQKDSPVFDYVMGVEVDTENAVPAGMRHLTLPAGDYARATIIKRGPQDVGAAFSSIYEHWLPASAYGPTGAPGFVYYDDRFFSIFNREGYAGNPVADVYVPIQLK